MMVLWDSLGEEKAQQAKDVDRSVGKPDTVAREWTLTMLTKYSKPYLSVMLFIASLFLCHSVSADKGLQKEDVESFLTELFATRAQFLLNGQPTTIKPYYLEDAKQSVHSLHQELRRSEYLNTWAKKRQLTLLGAKDHIRIIRIKLKGELASVSLINSLQVSYSYPNKMSQVESFGLGTRHAMSLKHTADGWHVLREWYLDPFDVDATLIPDGSSPQKTNSQRPESPTSKSPTRYNRLQAVEYAKKYAGAAWGAGNNNRYNPRYRDYTYIGGDCTNFASQVIGDPKGGGLPMKGGWRYSGHGGSEAWVRTDSFKSFLFYSGYARLIAKGYYEQLSKGDAFAKLQPGDLIAYEIGHGNVDHFAVVVGFDDNGYPLVNCHTADRYFMPFDLGWDKYTKFLLIHMND